MICRTTLLGAVLLMAGSVLMGCSSDEGRPSDGTTGGSPSASTSTSETKPAVSECLVDGDCESGVCFQGDQGSYCSLKCTPETASTVCAAPFAGTCNKKGYCKKL